MNIYILEEDVYTTPELVLECTEEDDDTTTYIYICISISICIYIYTVFSDSLFFLKIHPHNGMIYSNDL